MRGQSFGIRLGQAFCCEFAVGGFEFRDSRDGRADFGDGLGGFNGSGYGLRVPAGPYSC